MDSSCRGPWNRLPRSRRSIQKEQIIRRPYCSFHLLHNLLQFIYAEQEHFIYTLTVFNSVWQQATISFCNYQLLVKSCLYVKRVQISCTFLQELYKNPVTWRVIPPKPKLFLRVHWLYSLSSLTCCLLDQKGDFTYPCGWKPLFSYLMEHTLVGVHFHYIGWVSWNPQSLGTHQPLAEPFLRTCNSKQRSPYNALWCSVARMQGWLSQMY